MRQAAAVAEPGLLALLACADADVIVLLQCMSPFMRTERFLYRSRWRISVDSFVAWAAISGRPHAEPSSRSIMSLMTALPLCLVSQTCIRFVSAPTRRF